MAPIPPNSSTTNQLRQLIYYHIDNNLIGNALFVAERLLAYDPRSPESCYLLSLCHFRLGDFKSAIEYSRAIGSRGTHLGCAYVFALAAYALRKYRDGIVALEKSRLLWMGRSSFSKHTQSSRPPYADAAAVNCLLGKLSYGYDDKKKAISYFEEALKLNPFMWDAFTSLCDMGVNVVVPNIFKIGAELEAVLKTSAYHPDLPIQTASKESNFYGAVPQPAASRTANTADAVDPFNTISSRSFAGGLFSSMGLSQKINESNPSSGNVPAAGGGGIGPEAMETPTGPSSILDATVAPSMREPGVVSAFTLEPPQAPARKTRQPTGAPDFTTDGPPKMNRAVSSKRRDQFMDSIFEAQQSSRTTALASMPGEKKRTVSGQIVQPRQTHLEDSSVPRAPERRSVRLFNQIRPVREVKPSTASMATTASSQTRELKKARPPISRIMRPSSSASTVGRVVSGNRKPMDDAMDVDQKEFRPHTLQHANTAPLPVKGSAVESAKQEEALKWLLELFKTLGNGYFSLSQFQCQDALQHLSSLHRSQRDTPWVYAQIGRAYYEQAAYSEAEQYFKQIRTMAPTRFEDMEIYSTILWHLKRETDLAFLAHELIDANWHSPQAWCAMGNSWSLARDHEQALKSFKRATTLDPHFAYAFTLQGHEHVSNEEYDKALTAYRHGMIADKRHYNAYYGVGRVYEKLGNYDKAFAHFQAASSINPTNAVLICCIGTVLEKQKKPRSALQYFTKATQLAPRSALTRFKKARALMAIGETEVALAELSILKDLAPDEAMVHFLLGRLYKTLRENGLAVRHFTIALNLDPKASQQIKEAIESLELEDEEDEMSMMA